MHVHAISHNFNACFGAATVKAAIDVRVLAGCIWVVLATARRPLGQAHQGQMHPLSDGSRIPEFNDPIKAL